jgi:SAM-dependent methyltransferase
VIGPVFAMVARWSPNVRRSGWQLFYEYLAGKHRGADWAFMNYGFVNPDPQAAPVVLNRSDEKERRCIQLYHHVIRAVDLHGLDVLEVGCGRGGGCSYVARYLRPRSLVGVDLSSRAISLCRRHHARPGLSFLRGDAESLPIEDGAFDAVINIESSHCYRSMPRFLSEVRRVLRPGGHFLYADLRRVDEIPHLREDLRASDLHILQEETLTAGVLAALDRDGERKRAMIRQKAPWLIRGQMRRFAGLPGSRVYEDFRHGRTEYLGFVLRKPPG